MRALFFVLAIASGCHATRATPTDDAGAPSGDPASDGGRGVPSQTADLAGALAIDSLTASAPTLTAGQSITFTARLPALISILDAELVGDDGSDYGPFVNGAAAGTYVITLDWSQINQKRAIAFTSAETRTFVARFVDGAGIVTQRSTTVTLTCGGIGCCDGVCKDLQKDGANCGSCGHVCLSETCDSGKCGLLGADYTRESCASSCGRFSNRTCSATECAVPGEAFYGDAMHGVPLSSCDEVPPAPPADGGTFQFVDCCCVYK